MKPFILQIRKFLPFFTALCLLAAAPLACIGGGGGMGGGIGGGDNPLGGGPPPTGLTPPPPDGATNQAAPTMPDIAVGPLPDIVLDPSAAKGPHYAWRMFGTASTICHYTEEVPIQQMAPIQSKFLRLFEGAAYAAPGTSDSSTTVLTNNTMTVNRLKVLIKGQVQFNVDGGPFYDWIPSDSEPVVRALDSSNNVVDTKIKEAGNIEINFPLRLNGVPSAESFEAAMQDLHFYRTPTNFPTGNLDVPKTCSSSAIGEGACKFYITTPLRDMGSLVPGQPNFGVSADFAGVPECPSS